MATLPVFTQTAPYRQCPAIGSDTSCRILIVIDTNGSLRVLTDTNVALAYDDIEDTLVGVQNNSTKSVASIPLHGNTDIFGFDGDGICDSSISPHPAGCPFGPTGYEGPGVSFTNISSDASFGVVNFNPPIPPGGSAYFGLEEAIQTQCNPSPAPPLLLQTSNPWGPHLLGPGPQTIAQWGCFLTSHAMMINFYAAKQNKAFRTDPDALNNALKAMPGGFGVTCPQCATRPEIAKYARANGVNLYYTGGIGKRDDFTLDSYLCNAQEPVIRVGTPHWALATGQTVVGGVQTYSVNDPGGYPNGSTLQGFGFNYFALALYSDVFGPLNALWVWGHSPVELLLTDPAGNMVGTNPVTGVTYDQIGGGGYMDDYYVDDTNNNNPPSPHTKILSVVGPLSGTHTLQVIGTGNGPYLIEVRSYDSSGTAIAQNVSGTAYPGVFTPIVIQHNPSGTSTITAKCVGDVNGDGKVNATDFNLIKGAFGTSTGQAGFLAAADVHTDGRIDIFDLAAAVRNPSNCPAQ